MNGENQRNLGSDSIFSAAPVLEEELLEKVGMFRDFLTSRVSFSFKIIFLNFKFIF